MEIATLSATSLSQLISQKRLSPVDVIDAFLSRISKWDTTLHAFVEVYETEARLAAEAAHKAIQANHSVGPLQGIPIALKDLVEIEGKVVTGGCSVWCDRRSERTATVARRMISQGMIILGKTHLVQFAIGGWGTNQDLGSPWNPWNLDVALTPGGSSSGSGVAVASGLVPWAVGTDTGGSVRIPSSWCGLTGLKTTWGRIVNDGVLPLSQTLDTIGPMARSADDAALLYQVLAGHSLDVGPASCSGHARSLSGLRLAQIPASERAGVDTEVLAAYDASVEELVRLGAEIIVADLPYGLADIAEVSGVIMCAEAYSHLGDLVDDDKLDLDQYSRAFVLKGKDVSARQYLSALACRERFQKAFYSALSGIDAFLTPTTRTVALSIEVLDQRQTPSHFTRFVNLLNLCAVAVPNGFTRANLPTSLQIAGLPYAEDMVLRIARTYQSATAWHERRPDGLGLSADA